MSQVQTKKKIQVTKPITSCNGETCAKPKEEIFTDDVITRGTVIPWTLRYNTLPEMSLPTVTLRDMPLEPDTESDSIFSRHLDQMMNTYMSHRYAREHIGYYNPFASRGSISQTGSETDTASLPLSTIRATNKAMKKKLKDKYVTFEQKIGKWEDIVQKDFKGLPSSYGTMNQLEIASKCVMGTAWDGNNDWSHGDCDDCTWLGYAGLQKFSTFGKYDDNIHATTKAGFREYKDRWEYHWNKEHLKK